MAPGASRKTPAAGTLLSDSWPPAWDAVKSRGWKPCLPSPVTAATGTDTTGIVLQDLHLRWGIFCESRQGKRPLREQTGHETEGQDS